VQAYLLSAGKVGNDIVSFADPYATFAELAGVKPPERFKTDDAAASATGPQSSP